MQNMEVLQHVYVLSLLGVLIVLNILQDIGFMMKPIIRDLWWATFRRHNTTTFKPLHFLLHKGFIVILKTPWARGRARPSEPLR